MSEYKTEQAQEKEIEAGIKKTSEASSVDGHASLKQNIESGAIAQRMANANANGTMEQNGTSSNLTAKQIQQVISSGKSVVKWLYESFEDNMDTFKGNAKDLWIKFTELNPWEKAIAVLGVLAVVSLLAGFGYFSWKFVSYIWPKLLAFVKEYGPKLASEGYQFLKTIEASETYQNFATNLQNNINNIDLTGWNALVILGLPSMLALYKHFFHFLSALPGSG